MNKISLFRYNKKKQKKLIQLIEKYNLELFKMNINNEIFLQIIIIMFPRKIKKIKNLL